MHKLLRPATLSALLILTAAAAAPTRAAGADKPDGGAEAAARARYDAAADYSAGLGGRALLVMLDGRVVYERYDRGWNADSPHPLASGTKSFVGPLAAAAIQDKILPGWDAKVSDALPAWRDDAVKREITVRHLLSLSSGLNPMDAAVASRGGGRMLGDAAKRRAERLGLGAAREADDKHAAALAARMTGRPGGQFEYGPTHFYAFGAYLEARLAAADGPHKTVEDYFRARIGDPIGLKVARWGKDKAGHVNLPGGMALTAREWAKFGEFVRLGGAVRRPDGSLEQLIDPALLAECLRPSANNPQYGLTWWLPSGDGDVNAADAGDPAAGPVTTNGPAADSATRPGDAAGSSPATRPGVNPNDPARRRRQAEQMRAIATPDGMPAKVYMAAGLGKQRLIILPEQKLVVVRYAETTREGQRYSDAKLIGMVMGWPPVTPPAPAGAAGPGGGRG